MIIVQLIEKATKRALRAEDFDAVARSTGVSPSDLTDMFARSVVERYQRATLSWADADAAMNWLFLDYGMFSSGEGVLSPLARRVFEAFDEGEYEHLGEPEDRQGESRTRALLEWALTDDERFLAPFQPAATFPLIQASAVALAKRALAGEVTAIAAANELTWLLRRLRLPADDRDFDAFATIEKRTAHLPQGSVRKEWAAEALTQKDGEIAAAEKWAQEFGRPALLRIVQRFGSAA